MKMIFLHKMNQEEKMNLEKLRNLMKIIMKKVKKNPK